MKFLKRIYDNRNIIPLNISYNAGNKVAIGDDFIDILFKDMDTGEKIVETIVEPHIEVFIVNKQYRNYNYIKNCIFREQCSSHIISYKNRFIEAGKLLGIKQEEVMSSPYISQIDVNIEQYYLLQFLIEYKSLKPPVVNSGYLDIEVDSINLDGFPEPGHAPINCVTYIDSFRSKVFTLILDKNIVEDKNKLSDAVSINNSDGSTSIGTHQWFSDQFDNQIVDFKSNIFDFINELNERFDELHGKFEYNLQFFNDEYELIVKIFEIIRKCDNDFVEYWNIAFDLPTIIERIKKLGKDPKDVIVDKDYMKNGSLLTSNRKVWFLEDDNPVIHKKKHLYQLHTKQVHMCQMINYAGIRSAGPKLPSMKLTAIAQKELRDEKLDYSEEGAFKYFPYRNLRKFIIYNIKDVLLQVDIGRKTRDTETIYEAIYGGVLAHQAFTTTAIVIQSFKLFIANNLDNRYVIGINRNAKNRDLVIDYQDMVGKMMKYSTEDENTEEDKEWNMDELLTDEENETEEKKKRDKFSGAFVLSPLHMQSTGFSVLGKENKYIHDNVYDEDAEAEYPTAITIENASNDTLLGKIFAEEGTFDIPIYDEMKASMTKDEAKNYKLDPANFFLELISQDDTLNLGKIFFNLLDIGQIIEEIDENIDQYVKV